MHRSRRRRRNFPPRRNWGIIFQSLLGEILSICAAVYPWRNGRAYSNERDRKDSATWSIPIPVRPTTAIRSSG